MGSCAVFVTSHDVLIFTSHKTSYGLGVSGAPFFKAGRETDSLEIGSMILEALRSSRNNFELSDGSSKEMLEFAGYKSWRALEKDAVLIEIYGDKMEAILTPTSSGPRGGFLHHPAQAISCALESEQIGKTLFRMLEKAKGREEHEYE